MINRFTKEIKSIFGVKKTSEEIANRIKFPKTYQNKITSADGTTLKDLPLLGCDIYIMSPTEQQGKNSDAFHLWLYKKDNCLVYYIDNEPYTFERELNKGVGELFDIESLNKKGILRENSLNPAQKQICNDLLEETFKRGHTSTDEAFFDRSSLKDGEIYTDRRGHFWTKTIWEHPYIRYMSSFKNDPDVKEMLLKPSRFPKNDTTKCQFVPNKIENETISKLLRFSFLSRRCLTTIDPEYDNEEFISSYITDYKK